MTDPSKKLVALFAASCALAVANLYYAQPLIGRIAGELGISQGNAGFVMTLTQIGYGAGLLAIVPLADVVENRKLIVLALAGVTVGLVAIATATSALAFLAAAFAVGACAVATQILVPFVSHLTSEQHRGRVVGTVMSGLLFGIMLARPVSSFVAGHAGWRYVFAGSAVAIALLAALLARLLPTRKPTEAARYIDIVRSLWPLVAQTPVLRRRAFYQGMMFAAFNAFWTGSSLVLHDSFGLGADGIAWFALAGATGALMAPIAGRMADRGHTRVGTGVALATVAFAFALGIAAVSAHVLALLVVAAILLDGAVQVTLVLGLRAIYMLAPEHRGRLNGLFMAFTFACGAMSSALCTQLYARCGWTGLSISGIGFALIGLATFATE
jgi:predicted MFS family arabinose efflux permease